MKYLLIVSITYVTGIYAYDRKKKDSTFDF